MYVKHKILETISIFDVVDPKLKLNIDLFFENRKQEHPKMCYFKANIILHTFLKTTNQIILKTVIYSKQNLKIFWNWKKNTLSKILILKEDFFLSI